MEISECMQRGDHTRVDELGRRATGAVELVEGLEGAA